MADFTRGPWQVTKRAARRVTNSTGVVICNAVLRNRGGPKHKRELKDEHEAEANAQLIAAAPDLLEALQALFEASRIHDPDDWTGEPAMCAAQDAIRKATGGAA